MNIFTAKYSWLWLLLFCIATIVYAGKLDPALVQQQQHYGLWNRNGGAYHFAQHVSQNYVRSRRSAMFFAWLMGMIFHQGGTISTVLT